MGWQNEATEDPTHFPIIRLLLLPVTQRRGGAHVGEKVLLGLIYYAVPLQTDSPESKFKINTFNL